MRVVAHRPAGGGALAALRALGHLRHRLELGHRVAELRWFAVETILATVRFIRDNDDVLLRAQLGHRLARFRQELVNGREHHAADRPVQRNTLLPTGSKFIR